MSLLPHFTDNRTVTGFTTVTSPLVGFSHAISVMLTYAAIPFISFSKKLVLMQASGKWKVILPSFITHLHLSPQRTCRLIHVTIARSFYKHL